MKQFLIFPFYISCILLSTKATNHHEINEKLISRDRSIIRFLINEEYIVEDFIYQWEQIERRFLTRTMIEGELKKKITNEATIYKALKKYQTDNNLYATGIINNQILKKVFGESYTSMQAIDGGGLFGDYNAMKSYGEDDPNIGIAPKMKVASDMEKTSTNVSTIFRRKRSESMSEPHIFSLKREKKSSIFI